MGWYFSLPFSFSNASFLLKKNNPCHLLFRPHPRACFRYRICSEKARPLKKQKSRGCHIGPAARQCRRSDHFNSIICHKTCTEINHGNKQRKMKSSACPAGPAANLAAFICHKSCTQTLGLFFENKKVVCFKKFK